MVALEARERSLARAVDHSACRRRSAGSGASGPRPPSSSTSSASGATPTQFVANLSTGTRRIVELGCLVAADAKLLLLDEPTGGVAQRETEAFGPLILSIREELGRRWW